MPNPSPRIEQVGVDRLEEGVVPVVLALRGAGDIKPIDFAVGSGDVAVERRRGVEGQFSNPRSLLDCGEGAGCAEDATR